MCLIKFGPDGDIKLQRVANRKLLLDTDRIDITGAVAAKKFYINGESLEDYIESLVEKKIKEIMQKM